MNLLSPAIIWWDFYFFLKKASRIVLMPLNPKKKTPRMQMPPTTRNRLLLV